MKKVNVSVVLFNSDIGEISALVESLRAEAVIGRIILIDNSPAESGSFRLPGVTYLYNGSNLGYGAAHNIGIALSEKENAKYHLVINPDIAFPSGTIDKIYAFMEDHADVGQLMPKILYRDGSLQRLCKLLPAPFDLFGRRFLKGTGLAERRNKLYELDGFDYDRIVDSASLSGCFMFLRVSVIREVGAFDTRFFMYLEDYDLTRRIHRIAKTVMYPDVFAWHGYQKESYSNPVLLRYHVKSAVRYFNKWGWWIDHERRTFNSDLLLQVKGTSGKH
jgi:GT2 family glycosyltransferase